MNRKEFAERISAGLAGWLQQLAAQDLEGYVGEDAARVELVRMIGAQKTFVPATSKRPTNWPKSTKRRIDIAVLGKSADAKGWYGAIELKWPGVSINVRETRHQIVEDAIRVAFSTTANLSANFLVLGGTATTIANLFDTAHPQSQEAEDQRVDFNRLFSRDLQNPNAQLSNADLNLYFPDFGERVPQAAFGNWNRRFATTLIAVSISRVGSADKGLVYVWQCKK